MVKKMHDNEGTPPAAFILPSAETSNESLIHMATSVNVQIRMGATLRLWERDEFSVRVKECFLRELSADDALTRRSAYLSLMQVAPAPDSDVPTRHLDCNIQLDRCILDAMNRETDFRLVRMAKLLTWIFFFSDPSLESLYEIPVSADDEYFVTKAVECYKTTGKVRIDMNCLYWSKE